MKKPLDDLTKAKLIYSGELVLFAIAALVIAILTFVGVIGMSETKVNWITWITLLGGSVLIVNTIWFFCSKKKREKGSWLDTLLVLPIPLTMIPLDIIHLSTKAIPDADYKYIIPAVLLYVIVIYLIQAVYHWFRPLPLLIEAANEEDEEKKEDVPAEEIADKTPSESEKE